VAHIGDSPYAAISKKVQIAYEVPRADGPDISYLMAAISEAKHLEAAKKFCNISTHLLLPPCAEFGFIIRKK
jgi:hypothetical protein